MKYPHAVYRETVKYFSLITIATEHFDMVSLRIRMITSSSLNMLYFALKESVTFPRVKHLCYQFCLKRCYNPGYCTFHSKFITFRVYITFCVNFTFNGVTNFSFASDKELTAARGLVKLCTDVFLIFFLTNLTSAESGLFSHFHNPTTYSRGR